MKLMSNSKTILYYSSCHESPEFERKIRENIERNNPGLPIVSVSQKPIDFGISMTVGDVGLSYVNQWRQMLYGAKLAQSEWLVLAESDFLYPREYFEFEPDGKYDSYRYDNVWILFRNKDTFRRKKHSEGAHVVRREWLIEFLEKNLEGLPKWHDGKEVPYVSSDQRKAFHCMKYELFHGEIPCVSFKTGNGVRDFTNTMRGDINRAYELPHWGSANELKREYAIA